MSHEQERAFLYEFAYFLEVCKTYERRGLFDDYHNGLMRISTLDSFAEKYGDHSIFTGVNYSMKMLLRNFLFNPHLIFNERPDLVLVWQEAKVEASLKMYYETP